MSYLYLGDGETRRTRKRACIGLCSVVTRRRGPVVSAPQAMSGTSIKLSRMEKLTLLLATAGGAAWLYHHKTRDKP